MNLVDIEKSYLKLRANTVNLAFKLGSTGVVCRTPNVDLRCIMLNMCFQVRSLYSKYGGHSPHSGGLSCTRLRLVQLLRLFRALQTFRVLNIWTYAR